MSSSLIDEAPLNRFHYKLLALSSGGPFLDGYILTIVGVVLVGVTADLDLSTTEAGMVGAAALVGMFVGGFGLGWLTDRIGRQVMYTIDLIALTVGSLASMFVSDAWQLIALRFVVGVAIGADYPIATALLSEWLPRRQRGRIMGTLIVAWYVGATSAYGVGYLLVVLLGDAAWPWAVGSAVVPGLVILLARLGTPESPRWLVAHGRRDEARAALEQVYQREITAEELATLSDVEEPRSLGYLELFRRTYRTRTLFVSLFWLCQITPLFALYTFGPTILTAVNLSSGSLAILGSALISLVFLLGSLPALKLVESRGRRPLIVGCFALMTLPLAVLGILPHASPAIVILCFCAYALFSGGPGILEWIYPTELFPTEIRATAVGFATAVSRIGAAIGTYLLPMGLNAWGVGPTILAGAIVTFAGLVVCVAWAPETRGRALHEASTTPSQTRELHRRVPANESTQ